MSLPADRRRSKDYVRERRDGLMVSITIPDPYSQRQINELNTMK
jgi:hypothetical protein